MTGATRSDLFPALGCRIIGRAEDVPGVVEDVFSRLPPDFLAVIERTSNADVLRLGFAEVLRSILIYAGPQSGADDAMVEVWIEPTLMIIGVRHSGRVVPAWLVQNWDRGREPARFATNEPIGAGWLMVRQAFDSVSVGQNGAQPVVLLERRFS